MLAKFPRQSLNLVQRRRPDDKGKNEGLFGRDLQAFLLTCCLAVLHNDPWSTGSRANFFG